jgi:hypothetical protein
MPETETTVVRSACERYFVRTGRPCEWAVILLSEQGGVLSILSDWGSWSHFWPNHGDPSFKHFLLRVESNGSRDYLIRKLRGHRTDFDFDASVKALRRACGAAYRDREINKERCRDAIAEIENLEHTASADDFARQVLDSGEFGFIGFEEMSEVVVKRDSGALLGFLDRLWPAFIARLRLEVEGGDYQI